MRWHTGCWCAHCASLRSVCLRRSADTWIEYSFIRTDQRHTANQLFWPNEYQFYNQSYQLESIKCCGLSFRLTKRTLTWKKCFKKSYWGSFEPSIWTGTFFKHFLIVPLKATILEKFAFTIQYTVNRNNILCHPLFFNSGSSENTA
jgi:hypothetical protein